MPAPLQGAFNLYYKAQFPLNPFSAFIFLGAVLGMMFWRFKGTSREPLVFISATILGICLIIFENFIRNEIQGGIFPYSTPLPNMPGNTFAKAGTALLIITAIYLLSRLHPFATKYSKLLIQHSLPIYFVHLYMIYGGPYSRGMFAEQQGSFSPQPMAIWIIGLILAMTLLALLFRYLRTHKRALYKNIQHSACLSYGISFSLFNGYNAVIAGILFFIIVVANHTIKENPDAISGLKSVVYNKLRNIGTRENIR